MLLYRATKGVKMAYFGLSTPIIAKLDEKNNTYTDGFKCGKATGTSVTPNYNESSLYGDNSLAEYVKEFSFADVTASVTELPAVAIEILFGHKVTKKGSGDNATVAIEYDVNDNANYVGYGFFASEIRDGKTYYSACWLPKVKFAEGADQYNTKGESIEFSAPELTGKAMADNSGKWRYIETEFTKTEDAIAWLYDKANMTPASSGSSTP